MSTHTTPLLPDVSDDVIARIVRLLGKQYQGLPLRLDYDGTTLTMELSVSVAPADFDAIVRAAKGTLTRVERDGIETDLAAERTFRQQSQSEFIALTQNQRDRALFDVVNALINVQRAQLRDAQ